MTEGSGEGLGSAGAGRGHAGAGMERLPFDGTLRRACHRSGDHRAPGYAPHATPTVRTGGVHDPL
eukprot:7645974-Pyramimonas_sp.AAC.1